MDNISRRYSNEDTTTSMYLSFDAESTTSTACYKTLEAMSDTSNLSVEVSESIGSNQMNKTLEGHMDMENVSPSETVKKKIEILDVKANTPLKPLAKKMLMEYKALCSTPSKEQLLKTVDVTRGSDAASCVDLGRAFLGVDDGKPAFFCSPAQEENKENVLPDIEEMSALSTSGETTSSVIEKKMCSMSNVASITESAPIDGVKTAENMDGLTNPYDKPSEHNGACESQIVEKNCELIGAKGVNDEITPKANNEESTEKLSFVNNDGCENHIEETNCIKIETRLEDLEIATKFSNQKSTGPLETKKENKSAAKGLEVKENIKPQVAVMNRRTRFSVCEPNLQTGKPSRISSTNSQRRSLLPTSTKPAKSSNAEKEIPLLINRMLKIGDNGNTEPKHVNQISGSSIPVDKRRSLISTVKPRASLLTPAPGFKRPLNFKQRMSVLVKTTLNSPARKLARRSGLSGVTQSVPRTNISQAISSANSSKFQKVDYSLRKSMVPNPTDIKRNPKPHLNTLTSSQSSSTTLHRTTSCPLTNTLEKDKFSQRKADISYTCNVCKEKFRIKSLLDAHKRSHETDTSPPEFIKKASAIKPALSTTSLGGQNQCKYCDKKFALARALHIHLMQNCLKIPPSEKRKLQYTDLNHVEKAQLPNVFPNHTLQSNAASTVSVAIERFRYGANKTKTTATGTSSESLNDKKDKVASDLRATANGNNLVAAHNTAHKAKKITAHAGVYRTPSKTVPCHICKVTFRSILDYTNHNLASHGNNKTSAANDTGKDVERRNSKSNA